MRANFIMAALLASAVMCTSSANAVKLLVNESQKASLKGITSIKYFVENKANFDAEQDVVEGLSGLKIPTKHSKELPPDFYDPLSATEARVKVIVADREPGRWWVGLVVEQRCQVARVPAVELDAETYKSGYSCTTAELKKNIKTLCTEFVADLEASAEKGGEKK